MKERFYTCLNNAMYLLFITVSSLVLFSTAQVEPFAQTAEYQQIDRVWEAFIHYEPQPPLRINSFINREIERYASQKGYLWPENQKLVEEQLRLKAASRAANDPTTGLGQSYYYPYKGIAPFTTAGFRKYYDITFGFKYKVEKEDASSIETSKFIKEQYV